MFTPGLICGKSTVMFQFRIEDSSTTPLSPTPRSVISMFDSTADLIVP